MKAAPAYIQYHFGAEDMQDMIGHKEQLKKFQLSWLADKFSCGI